MRHHLRSHLVQVTLTCISPRFLVCWQLQLLRLLPASHYTFLSATQWHNRSSAQPLYTIPTHYVEHASSQGLFFVLEVQKVGEHIAYHCMHNPLFGDTQALYEALT